MSKFMWTDERDERLKQLVLSRKFSYTEIGEMLGISKNAVSGRIDRMSKKAVSKGDAPITEPAKKRRVFSLHPSPGSKPADREPPKKIVEKKPDIKPLCEPETWPERGQCQWLHGDPAKPGWVFCGHKVVKDSAWCADHKTIAYAPADVQRRARIRV